MTLRYIMYITYSASCRCAICKMQRNVPGATYFRFYRNVGIVIYFQWAWISNGVYTSVFSGHSLQPPLKCLQKWQRRTRSRNWPPRWFGRDYSFNEIILSRSPPCSVFDSRNHVGVLALSLGSSRVNVTTSSQLLCHTGCPTHYQGANLPKTKGVRSVSLCQSCARSFISILHYLYCCKVLNIVLTEA